MRKGFAVIPNLFHLQSTAVLSDAPKSWVGTLEISALDQHVVDCMKDDSTLQSHVDNFDVRVDRRLPAISLRLRKLQCLFSVCRTNSTVNLTVLDGDVLTGQESGTLWVGRLPELNPEASIALEPASNKTQPIHARAHTVPFNINSCTVDHAIVQGSWAGANISAVVQKVTTLEAYLTNRIGGSTMTSIFLERTIANRDVFEVQLTVISTEHAIREEFESVSGTAFRAAIVDANPFGAAYDTEAIPAPILHAMQVPLLFPLTIDVNVADRDIFRQLGVAIDRHWCSQRDVRSDRQEASIGQSHPGMQSNGPDCEQLVLQIQGAAHGRRIHPFLNHGGRILGGESRADCGAAQHPLTSSFHVSISPEIGGITQ